MLFIRIFNKVMTPMPCDAYTRPNELGHLKFKRKCSIVHSRKIQGNSIVFKVPMYFTKPESFTDKSISVYQILAKHSTPENVFAYIMNHFFEISQGAKESNQNKFQQNVEWWPDLLTHLFTSIGLTGVISWFHRYRFVLGKSELTKMPDFENVLGSRRINSG